MYTIRKGTAADLDTCARIYDAHLDYEAAHINYTNWAKGLYPTRATAQKALDAGTLYVYEEDGKVVGCANLNHVQPKEYANIPWAVPADGDQVLVIHTLVFFPTHTGSGRGRRFVTFAEELGRAQGCTVIRLDTWEGNQPAKNFYPRLGYSYAGVTEFFFENFIWENLFCYEKAL